ncbi:MAG: efflux RND transporter periplasmic adaptor subunit [Planctomycetota bacterium]
MSQILENAPKPADEAPNELDSNERSPDVSPAGQAPTTERTSTWKRRLITILGSLGLIAVVVGILAGIAWVKTMQLQSAMSAPPPPEMPVSVRIERVGSGQFQRRTTVVGTVLAPQTVTLRNEEAGTITTVSMQPGGTVKKGELLAEMDTRAESALLVAAEATLRQAKATLVRSEVLKRRNASSGEELDAAIAAAARAAAEVQRLKVIIERKTLKAPFDARVGLFQLHAGQYLDVGTEIVGLEGIDSYLEVDFAVPAHVADRIQTGDEVEMRVDSLGESRSAAITAMDARADPQTRLMMIRARIDTPPPTLVPGDSVLVAIRYGTPAPVAIVPAAAVRRGPSGNIVYVASKDEQDGSLRANARVVKIGGSDGTMTRVLAGLTEGEWIVADGSFKVFEGSLLSGQGATTP